MNLKTKKICAIRQKHQLKSEEIYPSIDSRKFKNLLVLSELNEHKDNFYKFRKQIYKKELFVNKY